MHAELLAAGTSLSELALRLADLPGLCWLDGAAPHADGRFSFLAAEPVERISVSREDARPLAAFARMEPVGADAPAAEPLAPAPEQVPRWVGYVAYDAHFAALPAAARMERPCGRPVLSFARYDAWFAFDHARGHALVVGDDAAACQRLAARTRRAAPREARSIAGPIEAADPAQHRAAIARALEHIARGDAYQVNLARAFRAPFPGSPLALFRALRAASPVPFGCYYDDGARVVLARSMERFLRWERAARRLTTRPIKGTLARGASDDRELAAVLRADEKERAEHAMIVDLMRNDLGRIAAVGSVHVPEVMAVEPFAGLLHLVSTVTCRTRAEVTLTEVLEATFPPGSVTGAPKLRAIEIIEALEAEPRDVYTGAVGFVDRAGGLSLAVAIRTAVCEAGELRYFAGGGIVEASLPERELAETELKAKVLRDALAELAEAGESTALSSAPLLR
jgi:para-aminobenzoate synthetase component 1